MFNHRLLGYVYGSRFRVNLKSTTIAYLQSLFMGQPPDRYYAVISYNWINLYAASYNVDISTPDNVHLLDLVDDVFEEIANYH